MFRAIDRCTKPVIGRIHGAALGGGSGLTAVCDIAIASDDALFGFTEVKLGIIPAVISPFVLAKDRPVACARAVSYRRTVRRAARVTHRPRSRVVAAGSARCGRRRNAAHSSQRAALKRSQRQRRLIPRVLSASYDETLGITAPRSRSNATQPEGQEGLRAFLERRKATFAQ